MTAYLNGAFLDAPTVDARDRGLLLGDGAFETILVEGGRAAFLDRHMARLERGLRVLRISRPNALDDAAEILSTICARDGLAGTAAARITVTRGPGPRGLVAPPPDETRPTTLMTVAAYARPAAPATMMLAAERRFSGAAGRAFKAIGGYGEAILAVAAAREAGADDALMLNEHGRLASATASNVFVFTRAGRILTPALDEGTMPGIVRGLCLEAGAALSLAIEEAKIDPQLLGGAAILLANSLFGLREARLLSTPPVATPDAAKALQAWYARRLAESLGEAGRSGS